MEHSLIQFDQIVGQSAAIDSLTTAYEADRLPHAMIFAGQSGVGKATTARALAGLFLCQKPKGVKPCRQCESCRAFDANAHPDYHVIYRQLARIEDKDSKARDLSAGVVREYLVAKAGMKAALGGAKVFVLEESDLMNAAAQNSLLKTLEEPAGRSLIILITDQPESLLATVRSRARLVRFAALSREIVQAQLEKRDIAKSIAAAASEYAQGSIGLALRWIEDGIINRAQELSKTLAQIVGGSRASALRPWLKTAVDEYSETQVKKDKHVSTDQTKREGLLLYLKLASQYFRTRLPGVAGDPDSSQRLCDAIDVILRTESYVESNVNLSLVLQQLVTSIDDVFVAQHA